MTRPAKGISDILATGGLNDTRVQYWEPLKWVAKLRETKLTAELFLQNTDGFWALRIFWEDMMSSRKEAFVYAFILDKLDYLA